MLAIALYIANYGKMEISAEKTKLMTNSSNGIQREIKVKGQKLKGRSWAL